MDYTCSVCGTVKSAARTPGGWSAHAGRLWCRRCWSEHWCARAVTVPAVGPDGAGRSPEEQRQAWQELRQACRLAWGASTRLANWAVTTLLAHDAPRTSADDRLPRRPPLYLYGEFGSYAGRGDWDGAAASANSVLRAVERAYDADRLHTLWHFSRSVRSFRWPAPYPVPAQNWRLERPPGGGFVLSLPLPGGRVRLRLDGSNRHQAGRLALLAAGAVPAGEAALYGRAVQGNDRRGGVWLRGPGGRQHYRLMVKLVGWFPRRPAGPGGGAELRVTLGESSLLAADQDGREPWAFHGDDLRRRVAGHLARLQRSRDDLKEERRWPAAVRRRHRESEELSCAKHGRFVATYLERVSAMVANLAERRRCVRVVYDDAGAAFVPSLPYYRLAELVRRKCEDRGISFVAGGGAVAETPGAARVPEGQT